RTATERRHRKRELRQTLAIRRRGRRIGRNGTRSADGKPTSKQNAMTAPGKQPTTARNLSTYQPKGNLSRRPAKRERTTRGLSKRPRPARIIGTRPEQVRVIAPYSETRVCAPSVERTRQTVYPCTPAGAKTGFPLVFVELAAMHFSHS